MKDVISYEDFSKLDIRIAKIMTVEEIEGADRLYKVTLDAGDLESGGLGIRTVAAGIKQHYQIENLVGKQVVYLANLEPRMLKGVESQGMILAADAEQSVLLQPQTEVNSGVSVC